MPPPPRLSAAQMSAASGIKFNDVPAKLADQSNSAVNYFMPAIRFVAGANNWMRDYKVAKDGTYPFNPNKIETRELFARAVVKAFAPKAVVDPSITFPDLPSNDPFYPFANVAVQKGLIKATKSGAFHPLSSVVMRGVHRALVLAVGLAAAAAAGLRPRFDSDRSRLRKGSVRAPPVDAEPSRLRSRPQGRAVVVGRRLL